MHELGGDAANKLGGNVADVANELGGDAAHELWVALHDYNGLGGTKVLHEPLGNGCEWVRWLRLIRWCSGFPTAFCGDSGVASLSERLAVTG